MTFLAALVLAAWFLVFWDAATRPNHTARPGLATVAVFTSIALALATFL